MVKHGVPGDPLGAHVNVVLQRILTGSQFFMPAAKNDVISAVR